MATTMTVPEALLAVAGFFDECREVAKRRHDQDGFSSMADALRKAALYVTKLEAVGEGVRALQTQPHHQENHIHAMPGVKAHTSPVRIGKGHGVVETISVEE